MKNVEGVIVGKRVSPHSSLLFTTEAFQPARKVTQVYKAPKMPRRSTQVRPRNTSGRAKKVSVLLSETGYANVHQLKQVLLDAGAKKSKHITQAEALLSFVILILTICYKK
ncbi:hypothetical protein S100333_04534 (plasmid) [Bacillus subtilis subsp. subtilis]|uniref:hypothetical protein n=1 Tax=Bacillus subtilis TaxID=1423 RepID=UPI000B4B37A5|nr:hypothetical protein [Bacillus subtilis]ASB72393.1 hypothetical protein S100333_04534 [Bacillus subtilis subsp. subtilis]